jgi:hypothetical protein
MFIPHPDIYPSRIPRSRISDPKTETKERVENICYHTFFWSRKIENYFIFEMLKKNLGEVSNNYRTFYPKKLSLSSQNMG